MTLLYADSHGYIPVSTGAATQAFLEAHGYYYRKQFFTNPTAWSVVAPGRFGRGRCLSVSANPAVANELNEIVKPLGTHYTKGYMGCFVNVGATNDATVFIGAHDAVNDVTILTVQLWPNGVIKVYLQGAAPVFLGRSEAGVYKKETDFFLEAFYDLDHVAGGIEVRVNTKPVISVVSVDSIPAGTAGAYGDAFIYGAYGVVGVSVVYKIGDFYFNDDQGSKNNTFLGNVQPRTMVVVGAGAHTGMTIGGSAPPATNWQAASNQNLTDAAYVKTAVSGVYDLYALDPILGGQPVHGLVLRAGWRQDDATQQNGHLLLKAGATTFEGGDHFVNQTYAGDYDIVENNPDTGLGMIGTDVNAMNAGPKNAT